MTLKHSFLNRVIGPCFYMADEGSEGAGGAGGNDTYDFDNGANDNGAGDDGAKDNSNEFNFDEFKNEYAKDYLDKPYMKAIDSPERLFKELDNAQGLIGKKLSVPGPDATDKEHDEYLDLIRPKDKSVYTIPDTHIPDNMKTIHPDGFDDKITDLFQKAALTPKQATILCEGYDKIMIDANGEAMAHLVEMQKAQQMNDADFNALADKTWGSEREAVQNTARALLQEFAPKEFMPGIENLSNENLVIMASVLKGVSDKYISQDDLNTLRGAGHGSQSLDSMRNTAQNKMAKLMSMDPTDPNYDSLSREVNDLYANIGKLSGDKK